MEERLDLEILHHFEALDDPRTGNALQHPLETIVGITLCAVVGGADSWVDIAQYGQAKRRWLAQYLDLTEGVPSHDTFGRLFAALDPDQFESCFRSWMSTVTGLFIRPQVVAIDGKAARRSHDRRLGKRAIHMVSAWATDNQLVLGQVKTEDHSNEIIAIPELLKSLDVMNCIVTIDAMGCQKKIAEQVLDQGGDYILALKENQGRLYESVRDLFAPVLLTGKSRCEPCDHTRRTGKGHGRLEERACWVMPASEWRFFLDMKEQWAGLKSVIMVLAERTVEGKTSREARYYISSLKPDAETLLHAIRSHWGIENSLHWVLDIAFREDESRVRKGNGQHNLTIIRRLALNLHKRVAAKGGIAARRKRAGWNNDFLLEVINS